MSIAGAGRIWSALVLAILVAGCGASLGRQLREDIGRATLRDIQLHVPEVLADHGYTINQRRETRTRIYYETSWLYRAPFDDELPSGVCRRCGRGSSCRAAEAARTSTTSKSGWKTRPEASSPAESGHRSPPRISGIT